MKKLVLVSLLAAGLGLAHAGFVDGRKAPAATPAATPAAVPAATPVVASTEKPAQNTEVIVEKRWAVNPSDVNLANTLSRWAIDAGWRVRWDAEKHFLVDAPDVFTGSFEDAVTGLLSTPGIVQSSYPLEVCFYGNTPPLARITRRGDQAKECK